MNKLKIERGISRIKRSKLQSSIDQSVANDIELMAEWSDNEQNYIVNELLRFAIAQAEDFQKYKAELDANHLRKANTAKPAVAMATPVSGSALQARFPISQRHIARIEEESNHASCFTFQNLCRPLIEYRIVLSFGLSAACGIVLQSLYPVHDADPLLRLLEVERPAIFQGLVWSYRPLSIQHAVPGVLHAVLAGICTRLFAEKESGFWTVAAVSRSVATGVSGVDRG